MTARCEGPKVQTIMQAGTESVEWLREEFCGVDLGDERLNRRLIKTAERLGKSPASPIKEARGDWAITQAAYRLFDNGKASPEAIRALHIAATVKRMLACGVPWAERSLPAKLGLSRWPC
ncbi:MAG TPA: transposase [Candidatus Tectomicrobia bacterium]